jgi:hypothetical protein
MNKVILLIAILSLGTLCWAGSAREDATERLDNATTVMHEIMGAPDNGIPEEVLEHAKGIAVVPNMVKGGFVFGEKGVKVWPRVARRGVGASRRSLLFRAEAGVCRSVLSLLIWS